MENELISFRFQIGEAPFLFNDALVMTQEAYDALTLEQITVLQQSRYNKWLAIINAPPVIDLELISTEENV